MPNQKQSIQLSIDLIEKANVHLESLTGLLLRAFVSCDQSNLNNIKATHIFHVCEVVACYALKDMEIADKPKYLDLTHEIELLNGLVTTIHELKIPDLAIEHTCACINGLKHISEELQNNLSNTVHALTSVKEGTNE